MRRDANEAPGAAARPIALAALVEALPDAAAVFDAAGRLVAGNRRFAERYGGAHTAKSCGERLLAALDASSRAEAEATFARIEAEPAIRVDAEWTGAAPERRRIRYRSTPIAEGDAIVGRLVLQADGPGSAEPVPPTELAELPNINPFPVLICDAAGAVRFLNLAARSLLDELRLGPDEAVRLLPPDFRDRIEAVLARRAGIVGVLHEVGGRALSVTFSPHPHRAECMVLLEDVTEHRRADERVRRYARELEERHRELQETQAALVQSEKMASLGGLVAGVAHEINTPVGSIRSNGDVMLRALDRLRRTLEREAPALLDRPELARTLDVLADIGRVNQTASERIVRIVRSLRTFARLDEAERKRADLVEGLESTITLVRHELQDRIELVRDYEELPLVDCFPNQMNQVFMNLLVNAAHAIEGKGRIVVRTRREDSRVRIDVEDDGRGIRPEHLERIFDPGFTTKGVGVGSGLGLAICYKIVAAHGGRIDVRSEPGRGATFTITLPVDGPPED